MINRQDISDCHRDRIERLLDLVWGWQKVKRLVGFKEREQLWDGLVVPTIRLLEEMEFASGDKVVDVGSGAGFPGLIMAILREDLDITLLDASIRKCTIMEELKRQINVKVKVECGRVEDSKWSNMYDAAIAMWFKDPEWAISKMRKMVHKGGLVVIISGPGIKSRSIPIGGFIRVLSEHHTIIYCIVSRET